MKTGKTDIEIPRRKWTPRHGSGKTRLNRGKARGESWTARREDAIRAGKWPLRNSQKAQHKAVTEIH
jgi:hypothetical protein